MKKLITMLAAAGAVYIPISKAAEDGASEIAAELVELIDPGKTFKAAFLPAIEGQMKQQFAALGQEKLDKVIEACAVFGDSIANDPDFALGIATMYAERFSKGELEFYKTDVGKKFINEMPGLTVESGALGEKLAAKHNAAFQAQLQAALASP
ncbi:MAG: DUF2059 domain-containing protein [Verrucomicrobiota bacterium]